MPECACGCGESTKGGKFLPGHEQKLRKSLEQEVGGVALLDKLVKAGKLYADGKMGLEDLGDLVRLIFRQD
jgi:hypothetical protein